MKPTPSRLSLALLAAALSSLSAMAQAESLKELYDAARGYDATYLAAKASAESAEYRAAQSEALQRPSVALQGEVKRNGYHFASGGDYDARVGTLALSATQSLYNAANSATIDKARRSLDAAAADLALAEQDLIVRVAQAYFDVLAAQDSLTTALANKKGIAEQLASAKRNFEVGTATITDTREAQAKYDLVTAQVIAAENDLSTRRVALDQLVGRAGVQPAPLAAGTPLPALAEGPADAWVEKVESSPSVSKAKAALDIAKLEVARAQAGHKPTVDLKGSIAASNNHGSYATSLGGEGTSRNTSVGVAVTLPLYAGNAVQNQVREALKLEEKARNDLEAARRGYTQGTRQAYLGVVSGKARVSALEAAEASSKLALDATQLGYKVGVRVNLDVLNAQTQLYSTQADLAKARYDVLLTSLKLRQAAGTLAAGDIAPIEALLQTRR